MEMEAEIDMPDPEEVHWMENQSSIPEKEEYAYFDDPSPVKPSVHPSAMAAAAASLVAFSATVGSDRTVRNSGIQGTNNIRFTNKSWTDTALACDSKAVAQRRHVRKVLCTAVRQSSKVSVVPVDLESVKEAMLNTYKPKGPYTATIVSVERALSLIMVAIFFSRRGRVTGLFLREKIQKNLETHRNVRLYSIASTR